jgi:uroporphyrinogen decarboxylase
MGFMQGKDRVARALRGEALDRIPRGELLIEKKFIAKALGVSSLRPEEELSFYQESGLDLACFSREESLAFFAANSSLFLFGLINGGLGDVVETLGFTPAMLKLATDAAGMREMIRENCQINTEKGKRLAAAGAMGIIIGDDIAYNHGTYASPNVLRDLLFPYLQQQVLELKKEGIPVLFHSDGNYMSVVEDLLECGFTGLQCLEEDAGMEIFKVKKIVPASCCLMGGLDLRYVNPEVPEQELAGKIASLMDAGKAGGSFIFGTNGGLAISLDPASVTKMFQYSEKYAQI